MNEEKSTKIMILPTMKVCMFERSCERERFMRERERERERERKRKREVCVKTYRCFW
jgi:hypothetical protein